MVQNAKFLFGTDFREERRASHHSDAELAAAREEAYARGLAEGEARARADQDAALLQAAGRIEAQVAGLAAEEAGRVAAIEAAAARLAVTLSRRLAAAALASRPMVDIEAAARQCVTHARGAPHLAVRVAESMVEPVDKLFARLSRETGYAGKVVVLGDPEIAEGDARMEWADGGLVLDAAARDALIEAAVTRALGTAPQDLDEKA